jgi:AcrR family transcriptional regulator
MPKDTFYNLCETKKRKIFDAAVQEFSNRRFSEASINQIVKTAGIPRGSFYQYFNDKEDLFRYMFETILKEKQEIIRNVAILNADADVFEVCLETTKASFEWSKLKPKYSRISRLMEIDDSDFITRMRSTSAEGLRQMIERDKKRGLIKPEIDSSLFVEILYTLIIKEYFGTGSDENEFLKRLKNIIGIIKEGVINNITISTGEVWLRNKTFEIKPSNIQQVGDYLILNLEEAEIEGIVKEEEEKAPEKTRLTLTKED